MPLPPFNEVGDMPEGVHLASFAEVVARFGGGTEQRREVTARLDRIRQLATSTDSLDRLIVFGSFITAKATPNDVDVVLVMKDDFDPLTCSAECSHCSNTGARR